MRNLFIALAALAALALAMPLIAADAPADGLKMAATKKAKNHVIFNHSTHTSADCAACHHPVDGKENYGKCSNDGCHSTAKADKKKAGSYYKIIHAKKVGKSGIATCVSCHKETAGKDKAMKKALTGCKKSKCHP